MLISRKSILQTVKNYIYFFLKKSAFTFLLLITAFISYGQESLQDSTLRKQTTDSIIVLYKNVMKENLRLYNGSEYLYSAHNTKGFPYFQSADMLPGSVYYDGNLYNNISMHYDLVNDELVTNDYTNNFPIKLIADKVKYFIIDGYKFINAAINTDFPLASTNGFYEELYRNKTIVFAKKQKELKVKTSSEGSESSYKEFDWYFIYYNDKVYKVSNEKSVLNILKKRKTELRKFINVNKINFKKNFEEALVKTTQYFDQIEN